MVSKIRFNQLKFRFQASAEEEWREKMRAAGEECQADPKTKIDLKQGKDDPNAAAHGLCLAKKLHLMDEHGTVNEEKVTAVLGHIIKDADKLKGAVGKCSEKKETPEETAHHLFECFKKIHDIAEKHHAEHQ